MNDDTERLRHIADTIHNIEQLSAGLTEEEFNSSLKDQLAIGMCFAILGEAASKLSKELRESNPDIPWGSIIGMRHVLVHDYMKISQSRIWDAIKNDVPVLKEQIKSILEDISEK
ncbi:HepT-like ribonuclease domain-containing protein [Victivallis vadensis]|uniref:HepT-like ribonuclease domain-containing protein n=1 Tax=Victivallis vadensis TaxID=172901 RepID=UPI002592A629|nr:HepT-like ribonuclease domain-containing protein [Victivallis vadensis]